MVTDAQTLGELEADWRQTAEGMQLQKMGRGGPPAATATRSWQDDSEAHHTYMLFAAEATRNITYQTASWEVDS
jgi:hypothetical protein